MSHIYTKANTGARLCKQEGCVGRGLVGWRSGANGARDWGNGASGMREWGWKVERSNGKVGTKVEQQDWWMRHMRGPALYEETG